jgi:membrane protein implicated in regulation of membrane protease activity
MPELLPYLWAALGLVLFAAELLTPGFVIIFFGAGGLLTAALTALVPGLRESLPWQILIWLAASTGTLFSLRHWLRGVFRGSVRRPAPDDDIAGRPAAVLEEIRPGRPGRVRFQGTTWAAVSYAGTFPAGAEVQIVTQDNLTLVVTAAFSEDMLDDTRAELR